VLIGLFMVLLMAEEEAVVCVVDLSNGDGRLLRVELDCDCGSPDDEAGLGLGIAA